MNSRPLKQKRMGTEGFLTISWDELSTGSRHGEKYVSDYPDMPETGEAEKHTGTISAYMYMDPYTPIYDPDTNKVKDEVIDSYERFIEKYPASNVREIIKGYYDILKADNQGDGKITGIPEKSLGQRVKRELKYFCVN